jgi:hypothetical protein
MNREEVYKAIDSERNYQDKIWNEHTTTSDGFHSFEEWFTYIEDYIAEAKHVLSRNAKQDADLIASDIMRKVGGMAVCAMEQHGVNPRVGYEDN